MTQIDGFLVIDKPAGVTSHDVVAQVRRRFGTRQVGHAGTLDPMATGVLVIGLNRATKFLQYIVAGKKSYLGTIRLGERTTTDDREGEVIERSDISSITDESIRA
ncbi:MAG: tRNA pseudouridine synthase, partial [Actinomycetota bacterium]